MTRIERRFHPALGKSIAARNASVLFDAKLQLRIEAKRQSECYITDSARNRVPKTRALRCVA